MRPVIIIMRPQKKSKYQQTVIELQFHPKSNLTRESNRFQMSGFDEVGQNFNLTNTPVTQE